ncbi:MAG TPA: glycosyltransferase family 2 protein [Steroidobacteraceae bacterium]|nr:glycosyltransferase family 2 protein [Steroidobacteraceae bacterium]
MNRTVSIVIPTFNRARLLPRAIDSALAQTVPVEVVVCDHGSTDDTPQVARGYGERIRYLRRDQDRGPIVCWRDGVEQASGELIHFNYDDDWIEPQFVARTAPLLRDDVGFVYTRARIHEPGSEATRVMLRHPPGTRPMAQIVQFLLRDKLTVSPGCALFRRRDVLKNLLPEVPGARGVYGKNSGVGEDLLLFLLAALDYPRYAHVPEALSHFLAHPTSITTQAGSSGNMGVLADAYAVAKQYYLQQPGSMAPAQGLAGWWAKTRWKLASRT